MDLGQSFTFPLLFRGKWEIWTGSVTLTLCLMMNLSKQMIGHTVSQGCAWAHESTHAHTKRVLTLAHAGNGSFIKGCLIYSKNHWKNSMKKKTNASCSWLSKRFYNHCISFLYSAVINAQQLGEQRVYFCLQLLVHYKWKLEQELKVGTWSQVVRSAACWPVQPAF